MSAEREKKPKEKERKSKEHKNKDQGERKEKDKKKDASRDRKLERENHRSPSSHSPSSTSSNGPATLASSNPNPSPNNALSAKKFRALLDADASPGTRRRAMSVGSVEPQASDAIVQSVNSSSLRNPKESPPRPARSPASTSASGDVRKEREKERERERDHKDRHAKKEERNLKDSKEKKEVSTPVTSSKDASDQQRSSPSRGSTNTKRSQQHHSHHGSNNSSPSQRRVSTAHTTSRDPVPSSRHRSMSSSSSSDELLSSDSEDERPVKGTHKHQHKHKHGKKTRSPKMRSSPSRSSRSSSASNSHHSSPGSASPLHPSVPPPPSSAPPTLTSPVTLPSVTIVPPMTLPNNPISASTKSKPKSVRIAADAKSHDAPSRVPESPLLLWIYWTGKPARSVFVATSLDGEKTLYPLPFRPALGVHAAALLVPAGRLSYRFLVDHAWTHDANQPTMASQSGPTSLLNWRLASAVHTIAAEFRWARGSEKSVSVAGSWNNWTSVPLTAPQSTSTGGANWTVTVPLSPGLHVYKFVVDGVWRTDSNAAQCRSVEGYANSWRIV